MKIPVIPTQSRINALDILLIAMPLTALSVYLASGPIMASWEKGRSSQAQRKAELLSIAASEYAQDHHNRFPTADHWEEELQPYLATAGGTVDDKSVCTMVPYWENPRRFAFNRALSGKDINHFADPSQVVLFYESSLTRRDAADNLQSLPLMETTGIVVAHGDGWTEDVASERVPNVITASHHAEVVAP